MLKGIRSVDTRVAITWDPSAVKSEQISKDAAINIVWHRLTVDVNSPRLIVTQTATSVLRCVINISYGIPAGTVTYRVDAEFSDLGKLAKNPYAKMMYEPTWKRNTGGAIPPGKLSGTLDDLGHWCADQFTVAWVSANPKP